MTLTQADYEDERAHYAWQCATCATRFVVNLPNPISGPASSLEARARALHCCYLDPEPPNGASVWWSGATTTGAPAYIWVGGVDPEEGGVLVGGIFDEAAITHTYREWPSVVVAPTQTEMWSSQSSNESGADGYLERVFRPTTDRRFGALSETNDCEIWGFRIDVTLDESPEGWLRDWTHLLAGLKMSILIGDDGRGPFTFEEARCENCNKSLHLDMEGPRMFHGYCRMQALPVINRRVAANYAVSVILQYRYEHVIPVGFFRFVIIGTELIPE